MEKTEEKKIFDLATEKLDLYVPLSLEDGCTEDARAFLQPGRPYVRFALKEFMKELLFELIKPAGEWTKDPYYIEKYTGCKKEDVIRKVPEDLWCDWLAQAPDEDRLGGFCDMVRYIRDTCGKYNERALKRAAEIREKLCL